MSFVKHPLLDVLKHSQVSEGKWTGMMRSEQNLYLSSQTRLHTNIKQAPEN